MLVLDWGRLGRVSSPRSGGPGENRLLAFAANTGWHVEPRRLPLALLRRKAPTSAVPMNFALHPASPAQPSPHNLPRPSELSQVIDRVLFKLDELVRPYVHKILVVIEPLLIDEDYYARVEGRCVGVVACWAELVGVVGLPAGCFGALRWLPQGKGQCKATCLAGVMELLLAGSGTKEQPGRLKQRRGRGRA